MAHNKGFSIVEVFIIIITVALIGVIGWKVWDMVTAPKTDSTTQTPTTSQDIKTKADLDNANKSLDSVQVDDSDLKQLDTEVNF